MEILDYYKKLLGREYPDAVKSLKDKYGLVKGDYYTKNSYKDFMNFKRRTLAKTKSISRINEGLYIHHIGENKKRGLSREGSIMAGDYTFHWQQANQLLYCNLVEHLILHAIIYRDYAKDDNDIGGINFTLGQFKRWYIGCNKPKKAWQQNCFDVAFLTRNQATCLLNSILKSICTNRKTCTFRLSTHLETAFGGIEGSYSGKGNGNVPEFKNPYSSKINPNEMTVEQFIKEFQSNQRLRTWQNLKYPKKS